jgi:ligand-binding SRPBCC domain-containing protein
MPFSFEMSSSLASAAEVVWAHATTMSGVNRELWPLARMTHPPEIDRLDREHVPVGRRVFRSRILLLGLVPVDYDDLTFESLGPGFRFRERSPMLTQREWSHERFVTKSPGGCVLTDRVRFTPRVHALGPLLLVVFRSAFRLRHRKLRLLFGEALQRAA